MPWLCGLRRLYRPLKMIDELAFLEVIRQSPADDGPRLIYADFLEEKGDPASVARAEFIRLQCLLARGADRPDDFLPALERERELQNLHWRIWMRPVCQALGEPVPMGPIAPEGKKLERLGRDSHEEISRRERYFLKRVMEQGPCSHVVEQHWGRGRDIPYLHSAQFRRGFVSHVTLAAKSYRTAMHVVRLLERTPVEGLAFVGCTPELFAEVLNTNDLTQLRTLELIFTDPEVIRMAARCPGLARLERLIIRHTHGNDDIGRVLAAGQELVGLRHLQVRACAVSRVGMEEFLGLPYLPNLETLGFPDCANLNDHSLMVITEAGDWPKLRNFDVSGARASLVMREILGSMFAGRLTTDNDETEWPELYRF
ncbi:TIGR02996 domain-containing protein [Zavarzinella formosa]|uniref:TIGR02996 domain-containing protein n=1 Tax=Zavarzinella formosa TaxID=360055 RepID=UPI00031F8489|nr:TIGR02996 domain-containing protein [Zavarzinella formosa]